MPIFYERSRRQQDVDKDAKLIDRLLKDVTTGSLLRRRRGNGLDGFDELDDDDDLVARRRREAAKRKPTLEDNLGMLLLLSQIQVSINILHRLTLDDL